MSELLSCEQVLDASPSAGDMPVVSVSTNLKYRMSPSRGVDVNYDALRDIMDDIGIPDDERGKIHVSIEEPARFGRRGSAGTDETKRLYEIRVYPTVLQQSGLRSSRLQQTVIHELQHVKDFIDRDYMNDPERLERDFRVSHLRRIIGSTAITMACLLTTPAVVETSAKVLTQHPELQNTPGVMAALFLPAAWAVMPYSVSRQILYRKHSLEKNAFAAAADKHAKFPDVISFDRYLF